MTVPICELAGEYQNPTDMIDAVATVIVLGTCFSSDLLQERPKHIMAVATLSIVSLSIVAGVQSSPKVRYTFLALGQSIFHPSATD